MQEQTIVQPAGNQPVQPSNPTGLTKQAAIAQFGQQLASGDVIIVGVKPLPLQQGKELQVKLQLAQLLVGVRRPVGEGGPVGENRESDLIGLTQLGATTTIQDMFAMAWPPIAMKVLTMAGVTDINLLVGFKFNDLMSRVHAAGQQAGLIDAAKVYTPFTLEVREAIVPELWEENGMLRIPEPVKNTVTGEIFVVTGTRQYIFSRTKVVPVDKCENFFYESRGTTSRTLSPCPITMPMNQKATILANGIIAPTIVPNAANVAQPVVTPATQPVIQQGGYNPAIVPQVPVSQPVTPTNPFG